MTAILSKSAPASTTQSLLGNFEVTIIINNNGGKNNIALHWNDDPVLMSLNSLIVFQESVLNGRMEPLGTVEVINKNSIFNNISFYGRLSSGV